ncbi:DDHD domain-containing protein [Morchella snyderi]|nr:DDHD domain-containing protein [Morchella snyderi]
MATRGVSLSPPPPINPYWFYSSPFPLDDPLAPFPIPTAATAQTKYPPRPFARYDSLALEAAYQDHLQTQRAREAERGRAAAALSSVFRGTSPKAIGRRASNETSTSTATIREVAKEGHLQFKEGESSEVAIEITDEIGTGRENGLEEKSLRKGSPSPLRHLYSRSPSSSSPVSTGLGTSPSYGGLGTSPNTRSGTTRTPFIRSLTQSRAMTMPSTASRSSSTSRRSSMKKASPPPTPPIQTEIPVGLQRLHQVLLPSFIMTPIYWSPLQDVASVMRGTWFYKDTMLPVEANIANRLEAGWEEVRAWTEEWEMELSSAVEVGREGEEKVRWQLFDKSTASAPPTRPGTSLGEGNQEGGMTSFETEHPISSANLKSGVAGSVTPGQTTVNEADWVLFANAVDAYICRDTMLSFGNKRPLANIRKGKVVGTHVVRGFQLDVWERLNPSSKKKKVAASGTAARKTRSTSTSGVSTPTEAREREKRRSTTGSAEAPKEDFETLSSEGLGPDDEERIEVTDLFLVIHGIGQKLSERVESFHFTHAINSFRRHINVELRDPAVRPLLRDGGNVGMMVLPINWRHNLSFDEEGLSNGHSNNSENDFSLEDITPPSIQAVRNLIGDVMLDIPYYLSHHKQKMIGAVVKEANRVYGLWRQNNPDFEKNGGRVHIIAHSLGTAIAMDILSNQPTHVPQDMKRETRDTQFDFDTKNVFFVGSPAAFFLLLNKRTLLPRRGRDKKDCDSSDTDPHVTGLSGTYGCMAADNIYNVLHYSDPIAYRLNPTVDASYAASLRTAHVPSTATTFLDTLIRTVYPSSANVPNTLFSRLPSTIELETHDFSREELAEKRLYLLNDNGQIDYFLQSSGALENQYLNMLGAHSSYWESRDFIRFCVVEAGRKEGRSGCVRGMVVRKKRGWK